LLYGKKIGAIRANTGDVALRDWLARQGADLSLINFVELDSAATILEAVRKGELDVGNIFTIWRLKAEEQGLPVVLHIDTLVPNFPCCRISTTQANVNARMDDYVVFLRGLIQAYKFFNEEQEKSLDIAVKYFDLDREALRANYYTYGHFKFHPDPARKRILEFYAGMVTVAYTSTPFSSSQVANVLRAVCQPTGLGIPAFAAHLIKY
jgi:NitT/TauT family transport system substrate-binding protein